MLQDKKEDFDYAYARYADMLYRLALSYLNCREDAQDAVHDVFMKYFNAVHKPEGEEHQRAWFVRCTINQCHDMLRKKKYRMHESLDEIKEIPSEEKELESDVCRLVSGLPEKYRAVITLHYLEGYNVKEVASMLKISVSAVKMRLSRGRLLLKDEI